MKLLIAEKPSVACKAYKELLEKTEGERFTRKDGYLQGKEFVISWCVGHLVGLAKPEDYGWGWRLSDLPFIPPSWKYQILPDTKKQYKILANLCKEAEEIISGSDAGREGQLITDLVIMMAGCKGKPQRRLWVNSFDSPTLEKAWQKMKPASEYKRLGAAAAMRSFADWMVGMSATVGYSVGTGQHALSVGRVQTPTLALIVERDLEIENWKPSHNFKLEGVWRGVIFQYYKDKETEFKESEPLEKIKEACTNKDAKLTSHNVKEKSQNPLKPFDLTELQKAANKRFGMKAAQTLTITQKLYEEKLVSYPRTDSQYLPETMKDEAFTILGKVARDYEKELFKNKDDKFVFFNTSKVSDHYAIIPTGIKPSSLDKDHLSIYALIREQFVKAFMQPYIYNEHSLELICEGHHFKARVKEVLQKGFKSLDKPPKETKNKKEEEIKDEDTTVESFDNDNFKPGDVDKFQSLDIKKVEATKPSHYNEATLLTAMSTAGKNIEDEELKEAMKERGLGTPSTKAAIIERLKKVKYIESKGKNLISTAKGRGLIGLVDENLKSPEMTGEWEFKLNEIAKGKYDYKEFYTGITNYITSLTPSYTSPKARAFSNEINKDGRDCPKCKVNKLIQSPKIIKCPDTACGFILWPTMAKKKLTKEQIEQLLTTGKTGVIEGFKSKAGKTFDAAVKFNSSFEAKFEFSNKPVENKAPVTPDQTKKLLPRKTSNKESSSASLPE